MLSSLVFFHQERFIDEIPGTAEFVNLLLQLIYRFGSETSHKKSSGDLVLVKYEG
jgi:hypothetical protein